MAGTLVANTINTDTGLFSTNNAYSGIAKAWVNFNGSTATVISSFNVSSVTRVATGQYTASFTTAMSNANYSIVGMASAGATAYGFLTGDGTQTTTVIQNLFSRTYANAAQDSTYISVSIFGA